MRAFSGVGRSIDDSLRRCTGDMKSRIQLSLALSIDFDCYLIDGTALSRDEEFQQKCWDALMEKRKNGASLIVASRGARPVLEHCDMTAVLANGALMIYDDVREGVRRYRETLPVGDRMRAVNVEGPRP
jgi:capsular polysaccharide transport system ATP-binding protein